MGDNLLMSLEDALRDICVCRSNLRKLISESADIQRAIECGIKNGLPEEQTKELVNRAARALVNSTLKIKGVEDYGNLHPKH
mgnify:CR=1 FL=1